jgi:type 1 glutamine amidotransferase
MSAASKRIDCTLIVGGKYHDMDYARLRLLGLLGENPCVRTRVSEDYADVDAITAADFLVTYTCDVTPSLDTQRVLRRYVAGGGRWFALHGTNSVLRFMENGKVDAPRLAPEFMHTLGSMFIAHPPIAPYRVEPTQLKHELTIGIEPFTTTDELYLMETYGPIDVLLHAEFEGAADAFVENRWPRAWHPVMYLRPLEGGSVLYLTLGHCRGHFDMQPMVDFWPHLDRGSWELPVFIDLVRRGLKWAAQRFR